MSLIWLIIGAYLCGAVLAATGVWKNPIFDTTGKRAKRILGWPWFLAKAIVAQEK